MNLKFRLKSMLAACCLATMVFSCSENAQEEVQITEVTPQVAAQFVELGFNPQDIHIQKTDNPFVENPGVEYVLEGDIVISERELEHMLAEKRDPATEQYRTTNLVSIPGASRTISVLGYVVSGSTYSLDNSMQNALQMAVANYNNENLELNFTVSFGSNTTAADIVVYRVSGPGGGQAGFPTGGNPYKWVQIQSGTTSYGTDVLEHVITHEIGHCIGFRHTDWFNRSISCGSGGSEGTAGVGAVHIPGTPTTINIDLSSIMLACFNTGVSGEFSGADKTALQKLYGIPAPPNPATTLSLSPSGTLSFGEYGGSRTINVTCDGSWTVSAGTVSVSPSSGNGNGTFTIFVDPNYDNCGGVGLLDVVTVNAGAAGSENIIITQASGNPQYPYQFCNL